jgi:AAA15 family ATPase/GTPase
VRIKSFRITNYKSFEDSGVHELAPHMNVIVGQNNVGKTALPQAIAQKIESKPHRRTSQRRGQPLNRLSTIEMDFSSTGLDTRDLIMSGGLAFVRFE